jgi:signal transduction histidine kinase
MRLSITTKIFLGFAVVIASFGVVSLYSIVRMQTLGENVRFIREGVIPARDALRELHSEMKGFEEALGRRRPSDLSWVRSFLPTLAPFERIEALRGRVVELAARPHLSARDRRTLEKLATELQHIGTGNAALEALRSTGGPPPVQLLLRDPLAPTTDRALYGVLTRAFDQRVTEGDQDAALDLQSALGSVLRRIDRRLVELGRGFTRAIAATYAEAQRDEDNAILAVVASATVALLISLGALLSSHLTLRPIRALREGVLRIAEGDYARRVPVTTRDEVGQLAAEFNRMAESLQERDRMLARQREALLRAERLATIGKMSSQITHEIRNPLSSIGLNVELLEEELLAASTGDAEAAREAAALLRAVTGEVDRLRDVTERYLRFARVPSADPSPGDLVQVVADLLDFSREELQTRGVQVEVALAPLPQLDIDVQQLRQAFLNLVRNAAEAMPDGGRLRVETAVDGETVVVRFCDSGVGIPAEDLDKVFDPFFSTKQAGTGLGLALTQQIVSDHGGAIDLSSRPQAGTTVSVRLPLPGAAGREPS